LPRIAEYLTTLDSFRSGLQVVNEAKEDRRTCFVGEPEGVSPRMVTAKSGG
jgi:hypothetical protein